MIIEMGDDLDYNNMETWRADSPAELPTWRG